MPAALEAFGARVLVIDGHDLAAIDDAPDDRERSRRKQPTVIVARTIKGRGFSEVENKNGWHGKPLPPDMADRRSPSSAACVTLSCRSREAAGGHAERARRGQGAPRCRLRARRQGGDAQGLRRRAASRSADAIRDVVALDGEVGNSTFADEFAKAYPDRYFEMFIAEQQMVAAATGLAVRGYRAFASTFAAFFTRAYDFIRMGAISDVDLRLVRLARRRRDRRGRPVADGPGRPRDDARGARLDRAVPERREPARSRSSTRWPDLRGISYMRTTRGAYPGALPRRRGVPGRRLEGAALRATDDDVTLIGAGVTCTSACERPTASKREGVAARVIDSYSVKPIDTETLAAAAAATGADRRRRGPPPRRRPRLGGHRSARRGTVTDLPSCTSRSATCRARARGQELLAGPASTPTTSSQPPAARSVYRVTRAGSRRMSRSSCP